MTQSPPSGLCPGCRFHTVIRSGKGSSYILCALSKTDRAFAKYPKLPVVECRGFISTNHTNSHEA
jgi:hypothetical protein